MSSRSFKTKLLIGEHQQPTAVDLIHAGGDGGELGAAEAEEEEEAVDDNNTVFATYAILCDHSVLLDDKDHVLNEHRTLVRFPFCEQEALMSAPIEWNCNVPIDAKWCFSGGIIWEPKVHLKVPKASSSQNRV